MKKFSNPILFSVILIFVSFNLLSQTYKGKSNEVSLKFQAESSELIWLSPISFASETQSQEMIIKVGIKSSGGIAKVETFVNDVLIPESRGIKLASSSATTDFDNIYEKSIKLNAGDNNIKVVVTNNQGVTTSGARLVNYRAAAIAGVANSLMERTDYALIFGTDDYEEWGDLSNPVKDAKTIAAELEENYGFKVELILNPSRRDVLLKLREYATKSYLPQDQLFIFYAGHGQFDEVTTMGYLATKDSKLDDPIKETYIAHSVLRDQVNNIPCDHILVMLDACFGGTFDQTIARSGSRGMDDGYQIAQSEFIARKLKYKTRRYVTSGGKEYVPDGRPGAHSPFARAFLDALRNYGGADRILTMTEMQTYFERLPNVPRAGEFGVNEPGSDFIFIAR
jgi:hypothetical protein